MTDYLTGKYFFTSFESFKKPYIVFENVDIDLECIIVDPDPEIEKNDYCIGKIMGTLCDRKNYYIRFYQIKYDSEGDGRIGHSDYIIPIRILTKFINNNPEFKLFENIYDLSLYLIDEKYVNETKTKRDYLNDTLDAIITKGEDL
ncbi:MAG: hypothetical protein ACFFDF_19020 [Candidatus Odinarchaeota archaeon]